MEGLQKIINSKSKTFLAFCFSFLAGVAAVSLIGPLFRAAHIYIVLLSVVSLTIAAWSRKTPRFIFLCLLFLLAGVLRYTAAFPRVSPAHIAYYNGQDKTVRGYIADEPDVRIEDVRYIVEVEDRGRTGRVYVKALPQPVLEYGDSVRLSCELRAPEPIEDFRYDMYMARFGVWSICGNAAITKLEGPEQGSAIQRKLFALKHIFAARVERLWHEPQASFMAGLLYGYRGGLGELNELFNRTGVTHIIAISGYNIAIIAGLLSRAAPYARIRRQHAFWVISFAITAFVILTGASASVIRAGIMGVVVLLAERLGRKSRAGNMLTLSAALMVLHNPFVLIWDAGFQLSFAATWGLIYLSSIFERIFAGFPSGAITESLATTLSAIIATLPLTLYQFGRLSVVAPLVNVLILWLIPYLMFAGFLTVAISFAFASVAGFFAWLASLGLSYIISVVSWFGSMRFAAIDFVIPWWAMLALYVILFYTVRARRLSEQI